MSETRFEDRAIFDRLADGELSTEERRALLSSLDDQPDGWRRCALALLEAQTWRQQFQCLVHDEAPPQAERVAAALPMQLPARPERWFTLAAGLLLAFGLGWSYRAVHDNHGSAAQIAESALEEPSHQGLASNSPDAVTLIVRDIQGNNRRLQLPLVEISSKDDWSLAGNVPAQVQADLKDRGLDLRSKRRYAPLFFEQGEKLVPMVVPVDDTYVVPVKRPVY